MNTPAAESKFVTCPQCRESVAITRLTCPWCRFKLTGELNERQRQVVTDIASGLSTKEIAQKWGRSEKNVEYHRMQAQLRLRVRIMPQVFFTHFALAKGWVKNQCQA